MGVRLSVVGYQLSSPKGGDLTEAHVVRDVPTPGAMMTIAEKSIETRGLGKIHPKIHPRGEEAPGAQMERSGLRGSFLVPRDITGLQCRGRMAMRPYRGK